MRSTEYFDDLLRWSPILGFWVMNTKIRTGRGFAYWFGRIHLNPVFLIKYIFQNILGKNVSDAELLVISELPNDYSALLDGMKPVMRISFNKTDVNDERYPLSYCRDIIYDRLYTRLKRLYTGIESRVDGNERSTQFDHLVNGYDIAILIS